MSEITGIEGFADFLAGLLDESARITDEFAGATEPSPESPFGQDLGEWRAAYGSEDVAGWVSEAVGIYVFEAGHLLRSLAALLRARQVTATLDTIVRCVVERVGHVNWILDPDISSTQRAARGGLEYGACFFAYMHSLHLLGATTGAKPALKAAAQAQRRRLEELFTVEKPPEDPCNPDSPPTGDVRRWVVEGQKYPDLTTAAKLALRSLEPSVASGVYGALSGFSHPNVVYSGEHYRYDANGQLTFAYDATTLEKSARLALFSFGDGVKHLVGYHDHNAQSISTRLDNLAERLERVCGSATTG